MRLTINNPHKLILHDTIGIPLPTLTITPNRYQWISAYHGSSGVWLNIAMSRISADGGSMYEMEVASKDGYVIPSRTFILKLSEITPEGIKGILDRLL
jgi:hypothetical protein